MLTDQDWSTAISIAMIMILIVLCIFPGTARVRPYTIAGYWMSPTGEYYFIDGDEGRHFTVVGSENPDYVMKGSIRWLRGVRRTSVDGTSSIKGRVDIGDRQIVWNDGDVWYLQGVGQELWW